MSKGIDMEKVANAKSGGRLTKSQKRARHLANLQSVANYSSKINNGRRVFLSAYPRVLSENFILRLIKGMGDALTILPPREVRLPARSINERLERSWYRTGMALYLAMDEYDSTEKKAEEDTKHSGHGLVTMAMK